VEILRISHCLDNRLTDGGEFVILSSQQLFTLQEDSWYSFLFMPEKTSGPSAVGRIR
jgi:hypothetical protein